MSIAESKVGGLALGMLVFTATGSPLLSELSMFGPALAQVLGATLLTSATYRLPSRGTLACIEALIGLGAAASMYTRCPRLVRPHGHAGIAALAGAIAQWTSPATAVSVMAALSVAVTGDLGASRIGSIGCT